MYLKKGKGGGAAYKSVEIALPRGCRRGGATGVMWVVVDIHPTSMWHPLTQLGVIVVSVEVAAIEVGSIEVAAVDVAAFDVV